MHYVVRVRGVPINWAVGFLMLLCVSIVVGALFVFIAIARVFRRRRWPDELRRRRALPVVTAHIEHCLKITDEDVRLVLAIDPAVTDDYRAPERIRLRGIARLPADAVEKLDVDEKVPVRFDAHAPVWSTLDVGALAGRDTADDDRDAYVLRGAAKWDVVR
jgi:hypothetical protein